jgi:hypothetical protein
MLGSALVYVGLTLAFLGVVLVILGFALPAREMHVGHGATHLDELMPRWQFSEHHTARVAAPPERVFEAIRAVRADEIALFRFLTWIRRGGREAPESILNPGNRKPILDVATNSGFISLADDPPREVVVGTVVVAPPGTHRTQVSLTPEVFRHDFPPGFALAAMNFLVIPDGDGGSLLSTDTRVYANDARSRRRFAKYWRLIYPGSSLIRVMWLRAIKQRAEQQRSAAVSGG